MGRIMDSLELRVLVEIRELIKEQNSLMKQQLAETRLLNAKLDYLARATQYELQQDFKINFEQSRR